MSINIADYSLAIIYPIPNGAQSKNPLERGRLIGVGSYKVSVVIPHLPMEFPPLCPSVTGEDKGGEGEDVDENSYKYTA